MPIRAEIPRHTIPAHLRREDVIMQSENIPEGSKHIGNAETEVLEYRPAEIYVFRYIRRKYLVPSEDDTISSFIVAPLPTLPFVNSMMGPGLLAQMVVDKICDHLPIHRLKYLNLTVNLYMPYSTSDKCCLLS